MKKLVFVSSLLVATMFAVVSCGKDNTPAQGNSPAIDIPVSLKFTALAGQPSASTPTFTVSLSDILTPSGNQGNAKYVSVGSITGLGSIAFSGITGTGVTLTNIVFTSPDKKINSPLLDPLSKPLAISTDTTLTATTYTNTILTNMVNYLASNKQLVLSATFVPTGTANAQVSGTITLKINGVVFTWN
jgi:hypothetical protein